MQHSIGGVTPHWTPALLDAFGDSVGAQYKVGDVMPAAIAGCQSRGAPSRPNIYNANIHDYAFISRDDLNVPVQH